MWLYALLAVAVAVALLRIVLRARRELPGAKLGDFVPVEIPRSLDGRPLAMGTRLDVGAALEKAGVPMNEVRGLIDTRNDAALLERYWALHDTEAPPKP